MKKITRFFVLGSYALVALVTSTALPLAAYASISLSLQSLYPSSSVSIGTQVSFNVGANGFTNPSYSITDSFSSPNNDASSISVTAISLLAAILRGHQTAMMSVRTTLQ